MNSGAPLWLFFLMVLGIVAVPGMDMAFVFGSSLRGGARAGLLAVAGIMMGGVFHVVAAALGLSLLVQWWPGLFNALLVAGAAYIAWIGVQLWRSEPQAALTPSPLQADERSTFGRALLTCMLNPKAYVFTLAVFPQFMASGERALWLQFVWMGLIVCAVQGGVYGSVALAAGRASAGMISRPRMQLFVLRATACVLVVGAVLAVASGWRSA
jgi:threonine/homoserine/homoserine lactone efflux protein